MKGEAGNPGWNRSFRVALMQQQHEEPALPLVYLSCPIFFPIDIPVFAYVQVLFENGNLMVIVMNVDLTDQKGRREGNASEPERRGLFRCSSVVGFHEEE